MDHRPYDNALGRFNSIDALTEMAPGITPYRFGFNNPMVFSDPTGLFETRALAMAHIRKHGMQGAEVSFNEARGYWEVSDGGFNYWESGRGGGGSGKLWMYYSSADGVSFVNLGRSGGGSSFWGEGYFEGYFKGKPSGEYGPYVPDAIGLSINLHAKTGILGEFNLNGGFAIDSQNQIALFGGYGGNFGYNGNLGIPSLTGGLAFNFYDNYGKNQDVLGGLDGVSKSYFGGLGFINGSYSKSAKRDGNRWYFDKSGVSTTSIGVGFGLGAGMGISNGGVWIPYKK